MTAFGVPVDHLSAHHDIVSVHANLWVCAYTVALRSCYVGTSQCKQKGVWWEEMIGKGGNATSGEEEMLTLVDGKGIKELML